MGFVIGDRIVNDAPVFGRFDAGDQFLSMVCEVLAVEGFDHFGSHDPLGV
jgi:hypothetical protein